MGKRAKSDDPSQMTSHHKVPRSRCKKGMPQPDNLVRLARRYHEAWHTLFGNMTPFEVVILLVEECAPVGYFRRVTVDVCWQGSEEKYDYWHLRMGQRRPQVPRPYHMNEVRKRVWTVLFGDRNWYSIVQEVLVTGRWAPQGYFRTIYVQVDNESTIELVDG